MLGWWKRKQQGSSGVPANRQQAQAPAFQPEEDGPIIAALLLDREAIDLRAAVQAIRSGPIAGQPATDLQSSEGILSLVVGGENLFVAPMGAPYPWSDLEGPCATAWMWPPQASPATLQYHRGHVLITGMNGGGDRITRRVIVTHLLARLAQLPGVVGVFWPEGTLVHYPPLFVDLAAEAAFDAPPLYLWIDYRLHGEPAGTIGCFTTGLPYLGLMDIEISGMRMEPGELREWAMSITHYMLERGSPIPHGDTIGATAEQRLRVTHGPSRFGGRGAVMRFNG